MPRPMGSSVGPQEERKGQAARRPVARSRLMLSPRA
jgi:hypothetical protein